MNRNNGRDISRRLIILRDYLYANADKTHAISLERQGDGSFVFCVALNEDGAPRR